MRRKERELYENNKRIRDLENSSDRKTIKKRYKFGSDEDEYDEDEYDEDEYDEDEYDEDEYDEDEYDVDEYDEENRDADKRKTLLKDRKSRDKEEKPSTGSAILDKEVQRIRMSKQANKPITFVSYVFAVVVFLMIAYLIKFMVMDSRSVIANSANARQDSYAEKIIRGDLVTNDGKLIATSKDENGDETKRQYLHGKMFSHVAGYVDYGKSGIELQQNFYLLTSSTNIFEKVSRTIQGKKNYGDTVVTTLDYDIQKAAYDALGDAKGAVIVMEPDTGKVLAMVSKPSFDPNDIDAVWEEATKEGSTSTVLLNRATQGLYAPGSTFKVLTSLAYIRDNSKWKDYSYECEGKDIFNNVSISCAHGNVHGKVDLKDSLAYSCNTSFANIGTKLNINNLNELCEDFLYNESLPYDGVYSKSKFVATSQMDKSYIPQTVIGQGETQITPLHNALIMSTIANGGVMMKPYFVDHIETYNGVNVRKNTPLAYKQVITTSEAKTLTTLMEGVTSYGTASNKLGGLSYSVAGKTGTAEYGLDGKVNSWFVGFSNVDDPDIVVSIVIEDADTVGIKATSVAREIFDTYYKK